MKTVRIAAAAALLLSAVSARGFVRETVHDSNGVDLGTPLYWRCRNVPFMINEQGTRANGQGCTAEEAIAAVKAGFFAWPSATRSGETEACTDFQFNYQGTTPRYTVGNSSDANLVVWRQGLCTQSYDDPCHEAHTCGNAGNCWDYGNGGIIALTTTTYVVSSGQIVHSDMEFFAWNGNGAGTSLLSVSSAISGWYFTCSGASTKCTTYGEANCSHMDLQNTATHEAGHIVGLDHEDRVTATMNTHASTGELTKRILADDDINGICTIYPKGSGTNDCSVSATTCGYGAGTGGAAGVLLSLLSGLMVRRRRRRA